VVSYLTEELVRQGHDVTLFASGDSVTLARLVAPCQKSLRLDSRCIDPLAHHVLMLETVLQEAHRFDLLHFHIDYLHFPISRRNGWANLTTLHGRLDIPELAPLYREYREMPLISISDAQRRPVARANWLGTVHHGLPLDLHNFRETPGSYLAFLGRISREKRVDRAIEIARHTGMTLKIAAKIDRADREYYEKEVRHLFDDPHVEFVGEVGGRAKDEFLGQAKALLFPIDWPEPFGLVMIEALACGTPVIAWPCGSVPEVIEPGVTGFLVNSVAEAVGAVEKLPSLSRRRCRERFEERFSVERMTRDYVAIYKKLLANRRPECKTSRGIVPAPLAGRRAASAEIAARVNGGFAEPRQGLAASS